MSGWSIYQKPNIAGLEETQTVDVPQSRCSCCSEVSRPLLYDSALRGADGVVCWVTALR